MQQQDSNHPTGVSADTDRGSVYRSRSRKANAAVSMRLGGARWDEIAVALGYPTARQALVATEKALERELGSQGDRTAMRSLAGARLERLLRSVWPKAMNPDHPDHLVAVTKAREVIAQHAKLYGLDAPTEIVVSTPTMSEIEAWVSQITSVAGTVTEAYHHRRRGGARCPSGWLTKASRTGPRSSSPPVRRCRRWSTRRAWPPAWCPTRCTASTPSRKPSAATWASRWLTCWPTCRSREDEPGTRSAEVWSGPARPTASKMSSDPHGPGCYAFLMAKVRWTQKCAGGCGTVLRVGTQATRLHQAWWCRACLDRHRQTCQVLPSTPTETGSRRRRPEPSNY